MKGEAWTINALALCPLILIVLGVWALNDAAVLWTTTVLALAGLLALSALATSDRWFYGVAVAAHLAFFGMVGFLIVHRLQSGWDGLDLAKRLFAAVPIVVLDARNIVLLVTLRNRAYALR